MIEIKGTDLTFIHIPKCGGTSVYHGLKEKKLNGKQIGGVHSRTHDYDEGIEYVVSVRNPYDRFYSYFHFYIEWTKKRLNGELPLKRSREEYGKLLDLLEDIQFSGWVLALKDNKIIDYYVEEYGVDRDAFRCQVDWFKDTIKPVHTFQIEKGDIFKFLNITKKHSKKTTYKTTEYTQEQKDIVYDYFENDFKRLGYKK